MLLERESTDDTMAYNIIYNVTVYVQYILRGCVVYKPICSIYFLCACAVYVYVCAVYMHIYI